MGYAYVAALGFRLGVLHVLYYRTETVRLDANIGLDDISQTWSTYTAPPTDPACNRVGAAGASIGIKGYILGGGNYYQGGGDTTRSIYNTEWEGGPGGTYTSKQVLSAGISYHSAFVSGSSILIAGGNPGTSTTTNASFLYTPGSDSIATVGNINTAREQHCGFNTGSYGYIASGRDSGGTIIKTSEKYDPGATTWSALGGGDLAGTVRRGAAAAFASGNGYIFAGGTAEPSDEVSRITERFDTGAETWSALGSTAYLVGAGFAYTQAGTVGTNVYLPGGRYSGRGSRDALSLATLAFDSTTETFSYRTNAPLRFAEGAVITV